MNRVMAHQELRQLLQAALEVLSPQRVALGADCSTTSLEGWLRRQQVQLHLDTVARVLPRLRRWQEWVPAYLAAQEEIRRMEAEEMACWENRAEELRRRLEEAVLHYNPRQVALACEVSERRLLFFRLGQCLDLYLDDLVRALGHLRHMDAWSIQGEDAEPVVSQAAHGLHEAGMTRYDLV